MKMKEEAWRRWGRSSTLIALYWWWGTAGEDARDENNRPIYKVYNQEDVVGAEGRRRCYKNVPLCQALSKLQNNAPFLCNYVPPTDKNKIKLYIYLLYLISVYIVWFQSYRMIWYVENKTASYFIIIISYYLYLVRYPYSPLKRKRTLKQF